MTLLKTSTHQGVFFCLLFSLFSDYLLANMPPSAK